MFSQIADGNIYINNDTTWSNTVIVDGNVFIDSNVILTIMPGTFVNITGYYAFYCHGTIKALGTKLQPITFTHLDTLMHSDTSTTKGGWHGIRILSRSINDTSVFKYCTITNGKAVVPGSWVPYDAYPDNLGGSIYALDFGSIIIKHCTISNNIATSHGGGIYLKNGHYVLIDSSEFSYNRAHWNYGGGAAIWEIDTLVISNNLFYKNIAFNFFEGWSGGDGGAIAISHGLGYSCPASVFNNRFYNNKAIGGILFDSYYNSNVYNNIICNNSGIGLFNSHCFNFPIYKNNTIANNIAIPPSGVFSCSDAGSKKIFVNNIVWNNLSYIINDPDQFDWWPPETPPIVIFGDIMFGFEGKGNIDTDPMFVNPTEGCGLDYDALEADWSLRDDSPLVNAGVPDTTGWNIPATDFYGNPRIYGIRIDIGAIENQNVLVSSPNIQDKQAEWVIYPNPSQNEFRVKSSPNVNNAFITLYDLTGRVLKKAAVQNQTPVSVKQIKPGIYFYKITRGNKILKTGKWIKQ